MSCECMNWERPGHLPLTEHHPNCPNYNLSKESVEVVRGLVRGLELWGSEEDGIYPAAWDAYKRGKVCIGEFNWKEDAK